MPADVYTHDVVAEMLLHDLVVKLQYLIDEVVGGQYFCDLSTEIANTINNIRDNKWQTHIPPSIHMSYISNAKDIVDNIVPTNGFIGVIREILLLLF